MKKILIMLFIYIFVVSLIPQSYAMNMEYETLSITEGYYGYESIDINFDGKMDIIAYRNNEIALFLNDGAGTYTKSQILDGGPFRAGRDIFHLVDYNHDNYVDIVYYDEVNMEVRYLENNQDMTFKAPEMLISTSIYAFNLEVLSDDNFYTFTLLSEFGMILYKQGTDGFTGIDGGDLISAGPSYIGGVERAWFFDANGDDVKDVIFSTTSNELRVLLNEDLVNGEASTLLASLPMPIVDIHFEPANPVTLLSPFLIIATEHDSTNPHFIHYMMYDTNTDTFGELVNDMTIANTKVSDFARVNTMQFVTFNANDPFKTLYLGVERAFGRGYYEFNYNPLTSEKLPRDHRNNDMSVDEILIGDVTGNGANDVLTITNTSTTVAVYRVFENAFDGATISFDTQGGTPVAPIQLSLNPYSSLSGPFERGGLQGTYDTTLKKNTEGFVVESAYLGVVWDGTTLTYVIDIMENGLNPNFKRIKLVDGKQYSILFTMEIGSTSHYVVLNSTDNTLERIDVPTSFSPGLGGIVEASATPTVIANMSQAVTGVSGGINIANNTIHAITYYSVGDLAYIYVADTKNPGFIHGFSYNASTEANAYLGKVQLDNVELSSGIPTGIDVADIDEDGYMDIIFGQWGGISRTVSILHGTNDPILFERKVDAYSGSDRIQGLSVNDFNQDGKLDIIYLDSDSTTKNGIHLLTQQDDGTFVRTSLPDYPLIDFSPTTLVYDEIIISDLNLDNYPDVIVKSGTQFNPSLYFINDNDGGFEDARYIHSVAPSDGYFKVGGIATGRMSPLENREIIFFDADNFNLTNRYGTYALTPLNTSLSNDITAPTKENATFLGYSLEADGTIIEDLSTISITGDLTLYAVWESLNVTLSFVDFDDTVIDSFEFLPGSAVTGVTLPDDPTREGYTFTEWSMEVPTTINENIVITAQYEEDVYTITYVLNDGTTASELTDEYTINSSDITLATDLSKTEHTFLGWYDVLTGDSITSIPTGSTGNKTFFANFLINQYIITIENITGSVDTYTFDYNEDISDFKLDNEGSLYFVGFFTDEAMTTEYVPTTMPAENISLYAKFVELIELTFVDKDGNVLSEFTFLPNADVTGVSYPTPPTIDGYTFDVWSADIPTSVETTNITIEALYDAIEYTITFDSNDGSDVTSLLAGYETAITAPVDPTKEGHTFAGWFTDEDFTEAFTFDFMPLDGATLYADWDLNSYDITIVTPISKDGLTQLLPGEAINNIEYGTNAGVILTTFDRVFVTGLISASGFEVEGLSSNTYLDVPTLAKTDMLNEGEAIVDLSFKSIAGILLTSEGRVFTFGRNAYLQIGNGDTDTSKSFPLTDITSAVKDLMDGDEIVVDVFSNIEFSAIITSSNRVIVISGIGTFQSLFGVANIPGSPVDVSQFLDETERVQDIMIAASRSLFRTNQGFIFNFSLSTGTRVPVTLPNALPDETIAFLHDVYTNDDQLVVITSTNRIVNIEYKVTSVTLPVVREYVENSSSNALKDVLNPGETVVSVVDQLNASSELIVLTSEGRVFTIKDTSTLAVVTEVTVPEMNEDEKFIYLTAANFDNFALITNFGRAFGFGKNRTVGAGLGVPPNFGAVVVTPNLVELFKISQAEAPLTFEFGEALNLEPLPDQGDLIFRGYFLDPEGTIPFTSDTMPAEDVILYPKFSNLLTYDMSDVSWDYDDAFTYDGTEFEVTIDETTLPDGVTVLDYTDNTATNAGTYTATVTFAYNEETHLEPVIVDLTWTINKATIDVSGVTWTDTTTFVYDDTEKVVTLENLPPEITVTYTSDRYTNAGDYTTTATLTYDTDNYEATIPAALESLSWSIDKATIDLSNVTWTDTTTFTYDSNEKVVTLENLPSELTVTYTSDRYTNAGDYTTTATFTYDTDNYDVTIPAELLTLDWTISKASLDLSNVTWTDTTTFTYDSNEKVVTLENLPNEVTVTYTSDRYTEAGDYTTTATFTYDTDNYDVTIPAELQSLDWTINKAIIDVSNVSWDYDGAFVFNGEPHTVTLLNLPQTLGVTYDLNTFINPGTYTTDITLIYDQNNYELVTIDNLTWRILPTYTITFYDGEDVLLEITNIEGTGLTAPSAPLKDDAVFKGWSEDVPSEIGSEDLDIFATYLIVNEDINMNDILDALDLDEFNQSDVTLTIDVEMKTDMIDDVSDFVDFRSDAKMFELTPKLSNGENEKTLNALEEEITISFITTFGLDDEDLKDLELYVFDSEGNALDFTYDETTKTLSVTTSDLMIYVLTPSSSGLIYIALFAALIGLISFLIYKGGFGFLRTRRSCFAIFARNRKDEKEENIYVKK